VEDAVATLEGDELRRRNGPIILVFCALRWAAIPV